MPHHRQKDQPQPSSALLLFWLSKLKIGRSFSFGACHEAVSRDFIGNCPFACMLLVFFSQKFAHLLPYSTCLQGTSLCTVCQGPTSISVIFAPISLFPHENCREWIASLSFLCISRAEMSNKGQAAHVVVLTEKKKLVIIFVLCFSVFSSVGV